MSAPRFTPRVQRAKITPKTLPTKTRAVVDNCIEDVKRVNGADFRFVNATALSGIHQLQPHPSTRFTLVWRRTSGRRSKRPNFLSVWGERYCTYSQQHVFTHPRFRTLSWQEWQGCGASSRDRVRAMSWLRQPVVMPFLSSSIFHCFSATPISRPALVVIQASRHVTIPHVRVTQCFFSAAYMSTSQVVQYKASPGWTEPYTTLSFPSRPLDYSSADTWLTTTQETYLSSKKRYLRPHPTQESWFVVKRLAFSNEVPCEKRSALQVRPSRRQ